MIPNYVQRQAETLGLHLYRESYVFGQMPSYRNAENTVHRFYIPGLGLVTASQALQDLQKNWQPVTADEIIYKQFHIQNDFKIVLQLENNEANQQ